MDGFVPFIHEKEKQKEYEPEYLYIELEQLPPPEKKIDEKEDERVIVIEIF